MVKSIGFSCGNATMHIDLALTLLSGAKGPWPGTQLAPGDPGAPHETFKKYLLFIFKRYHGYKTPRTAQKPPNMGVICRVRYLLREIFTQGPRLPGQHRYRNGQPASTAFVQVSTRPAMGLPGFEVLENPHVPILVRSAMLTSGAI